MTRSELFIKAHALTKSVIQSGDSYQVTFGACLKLISASSENKPAELRLQYQLSNGRWADCNERTEEFIESCIKFGRIGGRDDVLKALSKGELVHNARDDWYSYCRCAIATTKPAQMQLKPVAEFIRCKCCGQTGYAGAYPFSTIASSGRCDDCL